MGVGVAEDQTLGLTHTTHFLCPQGPPSPRYCFHRPIAIIPNGIAMAQLHPRTEFSPVTMKKAMMGCEGARVLACVCLFEPWPYSVMPLPEGMSWGEERETGYSTSTNRQGLC